MSFGVAPFFSFVYKTTTIKFSDKKLSLKKKIASEISRQMTSHWNPPVAFPAGLKPNEDGSFSRVGMFPDFT
jgi:hypothetical protein